jgi:hypothetical protein
MSDASIGREIRHWQEGQEDGRLAELVEVRDRQIEALTIRLREAEQAVARLTHERDALKLDKEEWLATKRLLEGELAAKKERCATLQGLERWQS